MRTAMWDCTRQLLRNGTERYAPRRDGTPVPYGEVLRLWREDEGFRSFFVSLLAEARFTAFRWETPPVSAQTAGREFEFVLLDEPALERAPDEQGFGEQFRVAGADATVVTFPNLGKDAVLVVPCPLAQPSAYVHLGAFIRQAPSAQVHALWHAVGTAMLSGLGPRPLWLSTAGMGVSWLHVRLDSRPKYYGFAPYRHDPESPLGG